LNVVTRTSVSPSVAYAVGLWEPTSLSVTRRTPCNRLSSPRQPKSGAGTAPSDLHLVSPLSKGPGQILELADDPVPGSSAPKLHQFWVAPHKFLLVRSTLTLCTKTHTTLLQLVRPLCNTFAGGVVALAGERRLAGVMAC